MKIKRSTIYECAFVCFSLIFLYVSSIQQENENETIFSSSDLKFVIGEVIYYHPYSGGIHVWGANYSSGPTSVGFKFEVEDRAYERRYTTVVYKIPDKGVHIGERYLVAYLQADPEKCLMLFDYPIKDSLDFEQGVKRFLEEREKVKMNDKQE